MGTIRTQVVIIGGGIIGCSIAYYLSLFGVKECILLEQGEDFGNAETGRSAMMVIHQTGMRPVTELAKLSIAEYERFASDFEIDIELAKTGSILYTTDPTRADEFAEQVAVQQDLGIKSELFSREQILKKAPFINTEDIQAASYCEFDGYVTASAVIQNFRIKAKECGHVFKKKTKALEVLHDGSKVLGVKTERVVGAEAEHETIHADYVVNAAGGMGKLISEELLGRKFPIRCEQRHLAVVTPPIQIDSFPILEQSDKGTEWYIRPEGNKIMIGVGPTDEIEIKDEPQYYNPLRNTEKRDLIPGFLEKRAPALIGSILPDLSWWAGNRAIALDEFPILGPVDEFEGFINCCGLSGFGITNAPGCGKLTAELIVDGNAKSLDISPFLLSRFPTEPIERKG